MKPTYSRWVVSGWPIFLAAAILWLGLAPGPAWAAGPSAVPLRVTGSAGPLLREMDPRPLGIRWTNHLPSARYAERQNLMNGAGVALGDYDSDGWCDIFLCGKAGPSALYRNLGGWRFEEVTRPAGVESTHLVAHGAVFADVNGDARPDLLVSSFLGPNACYLNLGGGRFTNATEQLGLLSKGGSTSQALADFDGDGDLDLYINYFGIEALLRDGVAFNTRMVGGKPVVAGRYAKRLSIVEGKVIELGEPDIAYRYDNGRFNPLDWGAFFQDEAGQPMAPPADFGLAVQVRDIDLDGDPDIYTCNDFQTPDRLWINDGTGHFRAAAPLALRNRSYASMGVDFADIDRDGDLDFITVEMLSREFGRHLRQISPKSPNRRAIGEIDTREDVARNGLYLNRGDGTYAELAWLSGVAASDWSWTPIFVDLDLDGFEDLLISNGHLHDVNDRDALNLARQANQQDKRALLLQYPRLDTPNAAYRNRGDLTFEPVSQLWGFESRRITHGMALADLDNDGDFDVVANCVNEAPLIYQNHSAAPRIAVRLKGQSPNTEGIGAVLTLRAGGSPAPPSGSPHQMQEIVAGGRYLSSDQPMRVFAVPAHETRNTNLVLEVRWRSGARSLLADPQPNTLYLFDETEAAAKLAAPAVSTPAPPWFEDVSARLQHTHFETPFDDWQRQPLLPRRLSQLGPGLAWFDWNRDGADDLIAGTGRGGRIALFESGPAGQFVAKTLGGKPARDDVTAIAGWPGAGSNAVLAGVANYEAGGESLLEILGETPSSISLKSLESSSLGPLAIADIDADGDLDLFAGGRCRPGEYPRPANSTLFRSSQGTLVAEPLDRPIEGLISAATFSDLNGDGFAELILAEEWGPIRVFENQRGKLTERTSEYGLGGTRGWWNSVTTCDLDNDGRLEIVAGNWGWNSAYQRGAPGPWQLRYGNFSEDQSLLVEAVLDPASQRMVPWRDMETLAPHFAGLAARFPTHAAYGQAGIDAVLGGYAVRAYVLTATTLASTVFWNRGGQFEPEPLPGEAQWAPAFGLAAADFDLDGHEDIFLAQNFFAVRPEDDRLDAGRGLLLRGGTKLEAMPGQLSGLKIYGEQRACAVGDFDRDGRVDLAVSQNGAATKLFRNQTAPTGVRVRLKGPAGNPHGYGAYLRARSSNGWGPGREIRAGGGYWSQDSSTLVFPANTLEITVRWPGGQVAAFKLPEGAGEVEIDLAGSIRAIQSIQPRTRLPD